MSSLFNELNKDRPNWANEEEVKKSWLKHLENALHITFHAERGRSDASHNQVIIEFKDKGLFNGSIKSAAYKEAIYDRLAKYIKRHAKSEAIPLEEYIGIAIDGDHVCFAFYKNGEIVPRNLLPFNAASVELVAQACRDAKRRAVTSENLIEDFGHGAVIGHGMMSALANELESHLTASKNNKIKMLFEEWRTLFGQVADLSAAQATQIWKQIPIKLTLPANDAVPALLFIIHTYNALLMKLLAAEIVTEYQLTAHPDFCEHLLGFDDDQLIERLNAEVERSAYFEAARIKGFVEEAIFSWYIDTSLSVAGKQDICNGSRALLRQLSLYRMDDLSAARSRDVLKSFYQSLVPETLRKALGEFYTPGWLVQLACDRAQVSDWLEVRVLDPTCGSGSFLLEAIRRKRTAADLMGLSAATALNNVLSSVWGFDLNPLAVQASRVNFLIAIADLVAEAQCEVELPVLLADAVYSPAHCSQGDDDFVEYQIGSSQSDLVVVLPSALAFDRARLDEIFGVMAEAVEEIKEYPEVEGDLVSKELLTSEEAKAWGQRALEKTYKQVLALHNRQWNGIWFRIVRNFFWSAVAGQFDLVVGNPPWVRWSNLPEHYRHRIKPTCEQYAIFSETPYHGGNELDISGMITYTVGDKWLRPGGTLVFVITQTHFQSGSSQGFRSFKIDKHNNFRPIEVDDLKKLKPFAKVANKTAVLRLSKVEAPKGPRYPMPYRVWEKQGAFSASIPEALPLPEVLKRVTVSNWEANPVDGGNSPWAILPKGRFQQMASIRGESTWVAGRKGVTTDLNGVFMVRVVGVNKKAGLVQVETRPHAGRNEIGHARRFWIEPQWLYPLVKGAADFSACRFDVEEDLFVLVPNKGILQTDYRATETALSKLKYTNKFLKSYKSQLANRSTYRLRQKGAPYFVIYNSGAYTLAPYKVLWAEMSSTFQAAVCTHANVPLIGKRPYVPDHKIYFADFHDADTAYYVCGLLNCALVREYIESHTIQIQVSNIFKHLRLPRYRSNNKAHQRLARLARAAHSASQKNRDKLLGRMSAVAEKLLNPPK